MMPGLEVVAVAGYLTLAAGKNPALQCVVPKAPVINVTPVTKEIEYDFTKSSDELGMMHNDTVNPYAAGADTTTGGLRHDAPQVSMAVKIGYKQHSTGPVCFWYDSVAIDIQLQPKIYIASDQAEDKKCRDAIIEHEKKHVVVDRQVINKYAQDIGKAVQEAINIAGGIGPYNPDRIEDTQAMMTEHVKIALESRQLALAQEMRQRQSEVDSYEEYERVSAICQLSQVKKYDKYKNLKQR